jgi:hypothetical protein
MWWNEMVRVSPSAVAFCRPLEPIAIRKAARPMLRPVRADIEDKQDMRATLIGTSDLAFE